MAKAAVPPPVETGNNGLFKPGALGEPTMKSVIGSAIAAGILAGLAAAPFSANATAGRIVPVQMGGGMMGGGMMGGGMMGGGTGAPTQGQATPSPAARHLVEYVRSNGLACFSCHAVYSNAMGPALIDVSKRYHGLRGARRMLADSISQGVAGKWRGFPAMPGGLASPKQAKELAELILSLGNPSGE